ncbi:1-phosphatidylinositol-3-phosphate 5-kinase FAB1B [Diplonema papillatum]|nr:1-phosphatidylinositol-3-phosphate 5-kinase FAB1B [Diplonema papillatum]
MSSRRSVGGVGKEVSRYAKVLRSKQLAEDRAVDKRKKEGKVLNQYAQLLKSMGMEETPEFKKKKEAYEEKLQAEKDRAKPRQARKRKRKDKEEAEKLAELEREAQPDGVAPGDGDESEEDAPAAKMAKGDPSNPFTVTQARFLKNKQSQEEERIRRAKEIEAHKKKVEEARKRRMNQHNRLQEKTKRGQPIMSNKMNYLMGKIVKSVAKFVQASQIPSERLRENLQTAREEGRGRGRGAIRLETPKGEWREAAGAETVSPLYPSSPHAWQPDTAFRLCGRCCCAFGVVSRRHHCRHCGNVFCGKCSAATLKLRARASSSDQVDARVCKICHRLLSFDSGSAAALPKRPLPAGLLVRVLQFTPAALVLDLSKVGPEWAALCRHPAVWRQIAAALFPNLGIAVQRDVPDLSEEAVRSRAAIFAPAKSEQDTGLAVDGEDSARAKNDILPAALMQTASKDGWCLLELPHYLPVRDAVLKRDWSLNLLDRLVLPDPNAGSLLAIGVYLRDIRDWRYFVLEKTLEVAYRDLEYPVNSSLFTRMHVVKTVLASLETQVHRAAAASKKTSYDHAT